MSVPTGRPARPTPSLVRYRMRGLGAGGLGRGGLCPTMLAAEVVSWWSIEPRPLHGKDEIDLTDVASQSCAGRFQRWDGLCVLWLMRYDLTLRPLARCSREGDDMFCGCGDFVTIPKEKNPSRYLLPGFWDRCLWACGSGNSFGMKT